MTTSPAIVRFTNARGETNYGVMLAVDEASGLVQVHWDRFAALLDRLPAASDFTRRSLDVRTSWCRLDADTVLLPIGTPVDWASSELHRAHRAYLV